MLSKIRMEIGIYNAASTLSSLEKWQNVTTQNIAAGNVPGYKGNQMSFEEIQAGQMGTITGGEIVSIPVSMSNSNPAFNFAAGQINKTDVPTHLAIQGDGFFKIQGDGFDYYTRDGEFHVNSNNQLVNKMGHPVMSGNAPVMIPNAEGGPFSISENGNIIQNGAAMGKVAVVDFEDRNALFRIPGGFRLPEDSDIDESIINTPSVHQGNLEASNVSTLREMVNLISISRAYELNNKVIQNLDEVQGKAIDVFGATQ